MFCDPDNWYELDACEICYDKISKGDNDIAFFSLNDILMIQANLNIES